MEEINVVKDKTSSKVSYNYAVFILLAYGVFQSFYNSININYIKSNIFDYVLNYKNAFLCLCFFSFINSAFLNYLYEKDINIDKQKVKIYLILMYINLIVSPILYFITLSCEIKHYTSTSAPISCIPSILPIIIFSIGLVALLVFSLAIKKERKHARFQFFALSIYITLISVVSTALYLGR